VTSHLVPPLAGPGAAHPARGHGAAGLLEQAGAPAAGAAARGPRHGGDDQRRHQRLRLAADEGAPRPRAAEVRQGKESAQERRRKVQNLGGRGGH